MPFVLDHDEYGKVIGGHIVEEVPVHLPPVRNFEQTSVQHRQATRSESIMPVSYPAPRQVGQSPMYPLPSTPVLGQQQYQEMPRLQAPPPTLAQPPQGTVSKQSPRTHAPSPAYLQPPQSNMSQQSPRTLAPSPMNPPPPHVTHQPEAPGQEGPQSASNGMSQRALRSLARRSLPKMQPTPVQQKEDSAVQTSTSVPLAPPATAVAIASPGFQPLQPDMREAVQRSLDIRDEQRRLIQYGQMGVVGPSYYPNEVAKPGPFAMQTGQGFGQMVYTAAEMPGSNDQHHGMGFHAPTEGFVRYMAEQQAQAAQWTEALQQGQVMSQLPIPAMHPFAHGHPSTAGYDQSVMPRQPVPEQHECPSPPSRASAPSFTSAAYPMPHGLPVTYGYGPILHHEYQQHLNEQQGQAAWPAQRSMRPQTDGLQAHPSGQPVWYGFGNMQSQQPDANEQKHGQQTSTQEHTHSLPEHLQLRSTSTPQPPVGGMPTMAHPLQHQVFGGHRHSHPGALLSYGPTPGPIDARMPPPTPAPHPRSTTDSLRGGDAEAPEIHRQGSVAMSQFGADGDSQQAERTDQVADAAPPLQPRAPTLSMYQFIQAFTTHYRNCPPALASFKAICLQFNRKLIDSQQFYLSIYRILYRSGATHLIDALQEFVPCQWRGVAMQWFQREVEQEAHEKFGPPQIMSRGIGKRQIEAEAESSVRAGKAAKRAVAKVRELVGRAKAQPSGPSKVTTTLTSESQEPRVSLIVKLPVRFDENAPRLPSKKQASLQDQLKVEGAAAVQAPAQMMEKKPQPQKKKKKVKKVPVNGFRAGSQPETPIPKAGVTLTEMSDMIADDRHPRSAGSSPLSSLASSPSSQTYPPDNVTSARRAATGTKLEATPAASAPPKKFGHGLLSAKEVPHVGPIYKTRHAVLARADKPYIHALCGMGFTHPQDVKFHHSGGAGKPPLCPVIKARNEQGRGTVERDGEWNAHESCKVSYPDLNYTSVKEGFVNLDKASADKLKRALEAGRAAKMLKDGAGVESAVGGDEQEGAVGGGESDEDADGEDVSEDVVMKNVAATATPVSEYDDVEMREEPATTRSQSGATESAAGAAENAKPTAVEAIVNTHMATLLAGDSEPPRAKPTKKVALAKRKVVTAGSDEMADDAAPARVAAFGLRARK
ncbi:hypothetical protein LTR85_011411 [Meristemomyces frigidus]|nr:hypothetical protein LTR85_011411 [Meristemomyces frigidus]